jgi:hypothetical protein
VNSDDFIPMASNSQPHWSELWHLWTVILPRRAINGQFVLGRVWRRHDGRQWIYKPVTQYRAD